MHWILKTKTDHIHCNLARLRVLSLTSRTDFDGNFWKRESLQLKCSILLSGRRVSLCSVRFDKNRAGLLVLLSVHLLRFSDVSQALSCSLTSHAANTWST